MTTAPAAPVPGEEGRAVTTLELEPGIRGGGAGPRARALGSSVSGLAQLIAMIAVFVGVLLLEKRDRPVLVSEPG